ncbi:MAG: ABC transporter permease [Spirochaetota bacterium]
MRKTWAIMRHEFSMVAKTKTFVVLTLLGPFLIFAVTVLPTLVARNPGAMAGGKPLYVAGVSDSLKASLSAAFKAMEVEIIEAGDEGEAKGLARSGKALAYLKLGEAWPQEASAAWYSRTGTDALMYGVAQSVVAAEAKAMRIRDSGLDPLAVERIMAPPNFEVVKLEERGAEQAKGESDFLEVLFTSMSFVMLLYMTVLLYGQMIGRSVVTEKTSKTVEIMLSSVTSRELMVGKILGLGAASMTQYAVWLTMAFVLAKVLGPLVGFSIPRGINPENLAWLVVFFVLAFLLYSSAYAALGAASEDEQHLGQLAWPLLIFLIVPLVMIGSLVGNPDSAIAVALSIFPMTSPIVMLVRILVSPPPAGQLVLSLGLLAASVAGMALLAGKIFRVGILMTGKRAKFGEVVKWFLVR